jgi:hypothetical protein
MKSSTASPEGVRKVTRDMGVKPWEQTPSAFQEPSQGRHDA